MKKISLLGKVLYWLILAFLFFVAGFTAITTLNLPGNYKLFVVMSGSMEPTIKTGSVVVIKPQKDYFNGDVITFQDPTKSKNTTTHRIVEASDSAYLTKGDANKTSDMSEIRKSQILGKQILSVPFIGYVINFAKTQTGLIILIVIPAVIIVYNELLNIKNEAKKLILERRKRKLTPKEELEEKVGEEIMEVEKEVKKVLRKKRKKNVK